MIGGGAAGAALAGRLVATLSQTVLLAEAGGSGGHPFYRVPLLTAYLAQRARGTWRSPVEPEPATADRAMVWPQGKVLGGSSAINGMVWMRGRPSDYDGWAETTGSDDWSWTAVARIFDAIEGAGAVPVRQSGSTNPLFDAFIAAGAEAGFPTSANFNQAPFEGIGRFSCNVAHGRRWSSADAFLAPQRRRPNLTVWTGARALRLAVERGTVVGAVLRRRGRDVLVRARETVVCAGAVNSPMLLLHSGIGDADLLRGLGIASVLDLPGVGQNLQDHFGGRVSGQCREPITLDSATAVDRAGWAFARAWLTGTGVAASSPFGAGFLLRSDPAMTEPDLEGVLIPALSTARLRPPVYLGGNVTHAYTCAVYPLRPRSRGSIVPRNADIFAAPVIRPRYFSDPADVALARAGVRIVRRILEQPAFTRFRGAEILPGAAAQSDMDLDRAIAAIATTAFHPVGTCRMGRARDGAVVGADLRVHGLAGLRVADASIMPTITSGNTNAPAMMIGYRGAELLRQN